MKCRLLALAALLGACAAVRPIGPPAILASAKVVPDFDSYVIRRVGLVPFTGEHLTREQSEQLQSAFFAEIGATTSYEMVSLDQYDLAEVPSSEPYRRGWYQPRTIIDLARRYNLDGLVIGTVTDQQFFPPQRLGLQIDLVASETGLVVWSSSVHLDAARAEVRKSLEAWSRSQLGDQVHQDWRLILISPRAFARFAAYQIGQTI